MVEFGKSNVPNLTASQIDLDRFRTSSGLGNQMSQTNFPNLTMSQAYLGQFGQ